MNPLIFLQIFLLTIGKNKSSKSLIFLDCGQNLEQTSAIYFKESQIKINIISLSSINDINYVINMIIKTSQKSEQIGIFLNFECKYSEDIIEMVIIFLFR